MNPNETEMNAPIAQSTSSTKTTSLTVLVFLVSCASIIFALASLYNGSSGYGFLWLLLAIILPIIVWAYSYRKNGTNSGGSIVALGIPMFAAIIILLILIINLAK